MTFAQHCAPKEQPFQDAVIIFFVLSAWLTSGARDILIISACLTEMRAMVTCLDQVVLSLNRPFRGPRPIYPRQILEF